MLKKIFTYYSTLSRIYQNFCPLFQDLLFLLKVCIFINVLCAILFLGISTVTEEIYQAKSYSAHSVQYVT